VKKRFFARFLLTDFFKGDIILIAMNTSVNFKKNEMDLTSGNLLKKLIIYSAPLILSGVLQLFYNAADLIVCGVFGSDHSTAAISCTNSLINLTVNLFLGLSVGANVLMARAYGAGDKEKGQRIVYTSMIYAVIFGVAIGVFGFFTSGYFLNLMGAGEVLELSSEYLKIYFCGLPFSMIYNFGSAIMRATGDTKRPFIFLTAAGIINIGLNLLFVIAFHLDVAGVAIATVISQFISAALVVIGMLKNDGFYHFKLREIKFYKREGGEIIRVGLPAGVQGCIFSLSNVIIQSSINSLGTNVMDGNGAASSLEGFIYTAMNSVAQANVAFVSANYGARKKENIKKCVAYSATLIFLLNLIIGGIILLLRKPLISLYVSGEEAITAAEQRLFIISVTYFICGFMDLLAQSIRGIGYSLLPMIVTLVGVCGFRITWIYTAFQTDALHNIVGVAVSYPISWLITVLIHLIVFIVLYRRIDFTKKDKQNTATAE